MKRILQKKLGLAIVKGIKYFLEKTHVIFQKAPTFELFQISEAIITLGSHCRKNSPEWAILKKGMIFFGNTHLHFQKTQILEHFEIFWAVILQEPQAREKMPRLPSLRKLNFFLKKPTIFPKTQVLNVWEIHKH